MTLRVYSPRPSRFEVRTAPPAVALAPTNLVGRSIAIVDNGKLLAFGDAIEHQLRSLGAGEVVRFRARRYTELATSDFLDDIAAQASGAVTGLGN